MNKINKIKKLICKTNQSLERIFPKKFFLIKETHGRFIIANKQKKQPKLQAKKEKIKLSKKDGFWLFSILATFLLIMLILIGGSITAIIFAIIHICKIYTEVIRIPALFLYIFPGILFSALLILSPIKLYYVGIEKTRGGTELIKFFLYLINIVGSTIQILGLIKFTNFEFMLNFVFGIIAFQSFQIYMDSRYLYKRKRIDTCLNKILILEILYRNHLCDFNNYLGKRKRLLNEIKDIFFFHFDIGKKSKKKMKNLKTKKSFISKLNQNKLLFYNIKNELHFLAFNADGK